MSLQRTLLEINLRSELEEARAEEELQVCSDKLQRNQQAIKTIEKWHNKVFQKRVERLRFDAGERSARVLYCHGKGYDPRGDREAPSQGNNDIADLLSKTVYVQGADADIPEYKELVEKWYAEVHGVQVTLHREHDESKRGKVYGDVWHMEMDWSSDEQEGKVKYQLLQFRRRYMSDMNLSMKLLKPRLTPDLIQKVISFVPPYTEHLKQRVAELQDRLDSPRPW